MNLKNTNSSLFSMKDELASMLIEYLDLDFNTIKESFELPPKEDMGELAFPCFKLAKLLKKAPNQIATDLEKQINMRSSLPIFLEKCQAMGPYLNFFYNQNYFFEKLLDLFQQEKISLVAQQTQTKDPVIIDFSSPNIAKPFHVGHAFSTIIGQCLTNLYQEKGYEVLKFNHLGDHGTQFGKLILAYQLYGNEDNLQTEPIAELLRIYVKFHEEAKTNPELEVKAREHFKNLEDGCQFEKELWEKFRSLSLKEFEKIYQRLNIQFDSYRGESFYSHLISGVVRDLENKNLLVLSEGAKVVELEEDMPPCLIIKGDGTTTYASRDLAAAYYRYDNYHFHKNIYVVGNPQTLHFNQVFSVLSKSRPEFAQKCLHVGFGLVKNADGSTMATRKGDLVLLEDLLNEAVTRSKSIIEANVSNRNLAMSKAEIDEIAEKIGIGAILFTFVKNGRERDILFSWEELLSFEGDTAPYLMYTYARCKSLLNKAFLEANQNLADISSLREKVIQLLKLKQESILKPSEWNLLKQIFLLSQSIEQSLKTHEPYILAKQLCVIAHAFNKFYAENPILKEEGDAKYLRLSLVDLTAQAIQYGLSLLNIETVERM